VPLDWRVMAVRVDFTGEGASHPLSKREPCIAGDVTLLVASLGSGSIENVTLGWDRLSINTNDPVEVALAAGLRESALAHVAGSTSVAYQGPWAYFVDKCASRVVPRCPLPAQDTTVSLYLQNVVERSKSFAPMKSALVAIAFF